ncbi:MAG: hypothetical protein RLZZ283_219 [Candidatus Parcubacteria bacterium]|jgi:hypothetical protein
MSETLSRDPKFFTHDLGVLTRRINALIALGGLTQKERKEYTELKKSYFAYAEYAIQNTSGDAQKAYIDQRIEILSAVASFEAKRLKWVRRQGVHVAEWFRSMSPALQYLLMGGAMTAVLGFSVALRSMAVGVPAAIIMVASAFGAGFYVRGKLNKWAGQGAENAVVRWIVNAREVEAAEQELQKALAEYNEKDRHTGVKRIARAMAKKRNALLGQKLTIMAVGSLFGIGAGRGALLAADAGLFDIVTPAKAATLHNPDGTTKEMIPTGESQVFYDRLLRYGGWFAVKNDDGTYNIYRYEPGHTVKNGDFVPSRVRFAVGGVKNLNQISEGPIPELKENDFPLLSEKDRGTVKRFQVQGAWGYLDPFRYNNAEQVMTEAEMRGAGMYNMTALPWRLNTTPEFWGDIAGRLGRVSQKAQELVYHGVFGIEKFWSAFVAGDKGGMSDKSIEDLFTVIFGTHITGADLPEDSTTSTIMTTRVNNHSEWAWWYWLIGQDVPAAEIIGTEDYIAKDMPGWRRAFFLAHELGHAIHAITNMDEAFNALSVEKREIIMRELYDLREYLLDLKEKGAKTGFKGWTDDQRQLVQVTARVEDDELFADAFSKLLTHPETLKEKCPELYKFLKDLINSNPRLRTTIGVK